MQQRQIRNRAVFDGSFDDPRTLVYFYQQKMRGQLLARAAAEAKRPSAWSVCLSELVNAFRWFTAPRPTHEVSAPLARPRASRPIVV
jgi:hypothetical protein